MKVQQEYRCSPGRDDHPYKEALCARLLKHVALVTNQAPTIKEAIQLWLRQICDTTHWPVGHASILYQSELLGEHLPTDLWHVAPGEGSESLHQAINANRLRTGTAGHRRIAGRGSAIIVPDLAQEADLSRQEAARDLGLRSALIMPVVAGDVLHAVCEFFSYESLQQDVLWQEVMTSVAATLARAIERQSFQWALRDMRGKLLNLQDDERRRLARELHDTTAQNISVMIINMDTLKREAAGLTSAERAKLAECADIARQSLQEIRSFSYLLHPPMLDDFGVVTALRLFVQGFSERSGIAVELDVPERSIPMPREVEVAIFRVVQESLSNVLKHSQSSTATVRVAFGGSRITITVEDQGKGLPPTALKIGVGIASMQERVRQCGGQLKLTRRTKGTELQVTLPVPEAAEVAGA